MKYLVELDISLKTVENVEVEADSMEKAKKIATDKYYSGRYNSQIAEAMENETWKLTDMRLKEKPKMSEEDRKFAINVIKKELKERSIWIDDIDDIESDKLQDFCDFNEIESLRFCSRCGRPMVNGYITPDYDVYCSLECLGMTEQEVEDQYDDDDECIFWTEWE